MYYKKNVWQDYVKLRKWPLLDILQVARQNVHVTQLLIVCSLEEVSDVEDE